MKVPHHVHRGLQPPTEFPQHRKLDACKALEQAGLGPCRQGPPWKSSLDLTQELRGKHECPCVHGRAHTRVRALERALTVWQEPQQGAGRGSTNGSLCSEEASPEMLGLYPTVACVSPAGEAHRRTL